ncbi:MAG: hypothetical protein DMG05_16590, partial [Acidobacteria bacterium]
MLRILYLLPAFLHPDWLMSGYLRHYHFLRELARRHAITLLALSKNKVAPEAEEKMSVYTERILTFEAAGASEPAASDKTAVPAKFGQDVKGTLQFHNAVRKMKRAFLQLVQEESYDLIIFHGRDIFPVIRDFNELPIVADFGDATSMRIRQHMRYASGATFPLHFVRYLRARRIEKELLQKTPHRAFISRRDREAVLGPVKDDSKVIPNGVDLGYWTRKTYNPLPNRIVYSGAMDYPPNADGAFYLIQKILPHVRRLISSIEVVIVGRDPSPALIKLAEQYPNVKVTGVVDDVRPYLEEATVYVGPLRFASGIQNKLLEA